MPKYTLASLNEDEVASLLATLSIGTEMPRMSGADLAELEEEDLKECGMKVGPQRRRLLASLDEFKREGVPADVLAASAVKGIPVVNPEKAGREYSGEPDEEMGWRLRKAIKDKEDDATILSLITPASARHVDDVRC